MIDGQDADLRKLLIDLPSLGRDRAHRALAQHYGTDTMSPSSIRDRLQKLKPLGNGHPLAGLAWRRFDELERGGDYGFLAELDLATQVMLGRSLTALEAQCAKSLRAQIDDLDRGAAVPLIAEYAQRANRQHHFPDTPVRTDDLDRLLVLKPWTPNGVELYRSFLEKGMAAHPSLGALKQLRDHPIPDSGHTLASWAVCKLGVTRAYVPWTVLIREEKQEAELIIERPAQDESLARLSWLDLVEKIWDAEW